MAAVAQPAPGSLHLITLHIPSHSLRYVCAASIRRTAMRHMPLPSSCVNTDSKRLWTTLPCRWAGRSASIHHTLITHPSPPSITHTHCSKVRQAQLEQFNFVFVVGNQVCCAATPSHHTSRHVCRKCAMGPLHSARATARQPAPCPSTPPSTTSPPSSPTRNRYRVCA